jgi:hypothetical protein
MTELAQSMAIVVVILGCLTAGLVWVGRPRDGGDK